jgi:hypothetical protein
MKTVLLCGEAVGKVQTLNVIFDFCTLYLLSAAVKGNVDSCDETFNHYVK